MKVQSNLDLCNFELQNFCVQSYTNTNNVEPTLARMLFVNGNENSELANRLVIHNGTGWKGFAYLDDLTTFKDEDFNALKEKVELLSGDVDTDAIINNMKDVEAFLEGFTESQTLMDLLNSKFDKTGGTITVKSLDGFEIKRTSGTLPFIKFSNGTGVLGYLGFSAEGNPSYYDALQQNSYKLIHKGNALDELKGTFLPLTGGTMKGTGVYYQEVLSIDADNEFYTIFSIKNQGELKGRLEWTIDTAAGESMAGFGLYNATTKETLHLSDNGGAFFGINTLLHSGNVGEYEAGGIVSKPTPTSFNSYSDSIVGWYEWEDGAFEKPSTYMHGAYFGGHDTKYGFLLASSTRGSLYYRQYSDNTWLDWKTIAFTDSTVAAAKRLVDSNNSAVVHIGESGFYVGDNTYKTLSTSLMGNSILFRTGTSASTAMTITEEGQVRVGNVATSLTNVISYIGGRQHIYSTDETVTLGNAPTRGLTIGYDTRGLAQWINSGGNIQAMRFDSATAYALNLNPLGGAVNIASTDGATNVLSTLTVARKTTLESGVLHLGKEDGSVNTSQLLFNRKSANYLWANQEGGYFVIGVKDAGEAGANAASLQIASSYISPGNRDNKVSLGTTSYRWSNVYSVGGDFSGRVLIGGALDDENYKLITNGAVKIGRSGDAGTYLGITVSDILTTFDANDNSDKYMRYSFRSHGTELLLLDGKEGGTSYFRTLVRFYKEAIFNGGALIPSGQKLTIGSVTFEESESGVVKVDGNLYTTGTLAAGGKGEEGESTGGSVNKVSEMIPVNTLTHTVYHGLNTEEVSVQIYERNDGGNWQMILTDVIIDDADNVTISFGAATDREHMCIIL